MRTHPFAAGSLIFGLLYAGLGSAFLFRDVDVWELDWSWFWPGALLVAGLLVLLSLRPQRQQEPAQETAEPEPAPFWDEP